MFLSSVKKIVEHREIKNPISHTEDWKLKSTIEHHAPITLVRLLVARMPLSEKQIGFEIFKLSIFSGILGIITAFLMGVELSWILQSLDSFLQCGFLFYWEADY